MRRETIRSLLILTVCLLCSGRGTHYHVKVWQPPIDTSNLTQPVRFWELVEWRPVSDQPTTTTEATTTTATRPPPPPPPPQPTPPPCDFSDPEVGFEFLQKLINRDSNHMGKKQGGRRQGVAEGVQTVSRPSGSHILVVK